ncbi:hypothetical protein JCM10213v2_002477 [Rhodosporidiobolus nylandii]
MTHLPPVPPLPPLNIEPKALPPLLPWPLQYDLIPFFPYRAGRWADHAPQVTPDALPPWSRELEAWYQLFHPYTWALLENDDREDSACLAGLEELRKVVRPFAQACGDSGREWWISLHDAMREVKGRRLMRWMRLYALHGIRKVFLTLARDGLFGPSDTAILSNLPPCERLKPLPALSGSVWPLPTSPPAFSGHFSPPTVFVLPRTASFISRLSFCHNKLSVDACTLPYYASEAAEEAIERIHSGEPPKDLPSPPYDADVPPPSYDVKLASMLAPPGYALQVSHGVAAS